MDEILKQVTEILLSKSTLENAEELKSSFENFKNFSQNGYDFRLIKSPAGNINFQVFFADELGHYYKPVGFFEFTEYNKIEQILILNEFAQTYQYIRDDLDENISSKVSEFSLLQNIFIALGSREVGIVMKKMFKSPDYNIYNHMDVTKFQVQNIEVNKLEVQLKTSMMGALEAVFIDKNNVFDEDYFIMFKRNNGRTSLHCSEFAYNEMKNKGLLTIF